MSERPILKRKGKKSGRIPRLPSHIVEDFDTEKMVRDLEKQLSAPRELTTLDIIRIQASKRWGNTFQQRALWLIENERHNGPADKAPSVENLPAVERWLRQPLASSYEAAMTPRRPKPKARGNQ